MHSRRAFLKTSSVICSGALSPTECGQAINKLCETRESIANAEAEFFTRLFKLIEYDAKLESKIKPYKHIPESVSGDASVAHSKLLGDLAAKPGLTIEDAVKELRRHFNSLFLICPKSASSKSQVINLEDENLDQLHDKLLEYIELSQSRFCEIEKNIPSKDLDNFTYKFNTLLTTLATTPDLRPEQVEKAINKYLDIYTDNLTVSQSA